METVKILRKSKIKHCIQKIRMQFKKNQKTKNFKKNPHCACWSGASSSYWKYLHSAKVSFHSFTFMVGLALVFIAPLKSRDRRALRVRWVWTSEFTASRLNSGLALILLERDTQALWVLVARSWGWGLIVASASLGGYKDSTKRCPALAEGPGLSGSCCWHGCSAAGPDPWATRGEADCK